MSEIPKKISPEELLSHSICEDKSEIKYPPLWVKKNALLPQKGNTDVSFTRACYAPDDFQKKLGIKIATKRNKKFRGFVLMSEKELLKAQKDLMENRKRIKKPPLSVSAKFVYSPMFLENITSWPEGQSREWGNGYNPAHADLKFSIAYKHNDNPNTDHQEIVTQLITEHLDYIKVVEEDEKNWTKNIWTGESLCGNSK